VYVLTITESRRRVCCLEKCTHIIIFCFRDTIRAFFSDPHYIIILYYYTISPARGLYCNNMRYMPTHYNTHARYVCVHYSIILAAISAIVPWRRRFPRCAVAAVRTTTKVPRGHRVRRIGIVFALRALDVV